jgi:hypothetical protein
MIYGDARVSTAAQDESGQVRQLKAAECESKNIFRDKITGTTGNPQSTTLRLASTLASRPPVSLQSTSGRTDFETGTWPTQRRSGSSSATIRQRRDRDRVGPAADYSAVLRRP